MAIKVAAGAWSRRWVPTDDGAEDCPACEGESAMDDAGPTRELNHEDRRGS